MGDATPIMHRFHAPISLELVPSDIFLYIELKRMSAKKKFSGNEKAITNKNAYIKQ